MSEDIYRLPFASPGNSHDFEEGMTSTKEWQEMTFATRPPLDDPDKKGDQPLIDPETGAPVCVPKDFNKDYRSLTHQGRIRIGSDYFLPNIGPFASFLAPETRLNPNTKKFDTPHFNERAWFSAPHEYFFDDGKIKVRVRIWASEDPIGEFITVSPEEIGTTAHQALAAYLAALNNDVSDSGAEKTESGFVMEDSTDVKPDSEQGFRDKIAEAKTSGKSHVEFTFNDALEPIFGRITLQECFVSLVRYGYFKEATSVDIKNLKVSFTLEAAENFLDQVFGQKYLENYQGETQGETIRDYTGPTSGSIQYYFYGGEDKRTNHFDSVMESMAVYRARENAFTTPVEKNYDYATAAAQKDMTFGKVEDKYKAGTIYLPVLYNVQKKRVEVVTGPEYYDESKSLSYGAEWFDNNSQVTTGFNLPLGYRLPSAEELAGFRIDNEGYVVPKEKKGDATFLPLRITYLGDGIHIVNDENMFVLGMTANQNPLPLLAVSSFYQPVSEEELTVLSEVNRETNKYVEYNNVNDGLGVGKGWGLDGGWGMNIGWGTNVWMTYDQAYAFGMMTEKQGMEMPLRRREDLGFDYEYFGLEEPFPLGLPFVELADLDLDYIDQNTQKVACYAVSFNKTHFATMAEALSGLIAASTDGIVHLSSGVDLTIQQAQELFSALENGSRGFFETVDKFVRGTKWAQYAIYGLMILAVGLIQSHSASIPGLGRMTANRTASDKVEEERKKLNPGFLKRILLGKPVLYPTFFGRNTELVELIDTISDVRDLHDAGKNVAGSIVILADAGEGKTEFMYQLPRTVATGRLPPRAADYGTDSWVIQPNPDGPNAENDYYPDLTRPAYMPKGRPLSEVYGNNFKAPSGFLGRAWADLKGQLYSYGLVRSLSGSERLRAWIMHDLKINEAIAGTMFRGTLENKMKAVARTATNDRRRLVLNDEIARQITYGKSAMDSSPPFDQFIPYLSGHLMVLGTATRGDWEKVKANDDGQKIRRFGNEIQLPALDTPNLVLSLNGFAMEYMDKFARLSKRNTEIKNDALKLSHADLMDLKAHDEALLRGESYQPKRNTFYHQVIAYMKGKNLKYSATAASGVYLTQYLSSCVTRARAGKPVTISIEDFDAFVQTKITQSGTFLEEARNKFKEMMQSLQVTGDDKTQLEGLFAEIIKRITGEEDFDYTLRMEVLVNSLNKIQEEFKKIRKRMIKTPGKAQDERAQMISVLNQVLQSHKDQFMSDTTSTGSSASSASLPSFDTNLLGPQAQTLYASLDDVPRPRDPAYDQMLDHLETIYGAIPGETAAARAARLAQTESEIQAYLSVFYTTDGRGHLTPRTPPPDAAMIAAANRSLQDVLQAKSAEANGLRAAAVPPTAPPPPPVKTPAQIADEALLAQLTATGIEHGDYADELSKTAYALGNGHYGRLDIIEKATREIAALDKIDPATKEKARGILIKAMLDASKTIPGFDINTCPKLKAYAEKQRWLPTVFGTIADDLAQFYTDNTDAKVIRSQAKTKYEELHMTHSHDPQAALLFAQVKTTHNKANADVTSSHFKLDEYTFKLMVLKAYAQYMNNAQFLSKSDDEKLAQAQAEFVKTLKATKGFATKKPGSTPEDAKSDLDKNLAAFSKIMAENMVTLSQKARSRH